MSDKITRKDFLRGIGYSTLAAGVAPASLGREVPPEHESQPIIRARGSQRPLIQELNPVMRLYPAKAVERTGHVRFGAAEIDVMLPFFGDGEVVWNLTVPATGEYRVAACYSATKAGISVEVSCGASSIRHDTEVTEGFLTPDPAGPSPNPGGPGHATFRSERGFYSFERLYLPGTLNLSCGVNVVTLRVRGHTGGEIFRLRSLELTPVARTAAVARSRNLALRHRANTDWFVKAGYGVWFHFLDFTTPRHGPRKPYAQAVDDLDVNALASLVDEMGARYVIFTTNHGDPTCPAPIKSWEDIHPGWTTKRDLIADLADALNRRGIRLLLYMNCPGLGNLVQLASGAVDRPTYSEERYAEILTQVLREFGLRYREKVAGYWFDSWFQTGESYPNLPFEQLSQAIKSGNSDCLIAYNYWSFPIETEWQDYWAGELTTLPLKRFGSRHIQRGAGKGLQAHSAIRLDSSWFHITPDTPIGPPIYTAEQLSEYIKSCMDDQAVVSVGIAIYQDGTVSESSRRVMRSVRRLVRGT